MTPEGKVVQALREAVAEAEGECRKVNWSGHIGAPDWFVMVAGLHFFVECKAPGKKPSVIQLREHERMRAIGGCRVFVVDGVDKIRNLIRNIERGVLS